MKKSRSRAGTTRSASGRGVGELERGALVGVAQVAQEARVAVGVPVGVGIGVWQVKQLREPAAVPELPGVAREAAAAAARAGARARGRDLVGAARRAGRRARARVGVGRAVEAGTRPPAGWCSPDAHAAQELAPAIAAKVPGAHALQRKAGQPAHSGSASSRSCPARQTQASEAAAPSGFALAAGQAGQAVAATCGWYSPAGHGRQAGCVAAR
jgi:hypothetical protein